jgi:hypothetical protein
MGQGVPCIEFEGFSAGASFPQGQVISESGFPMNIGTYTDGEQTYFESAFIAAFSPYQVQSLGFSTASVTIDVGCAEEVRVVFATSAGGVNVGSTGKCSCPRT